MFLGPDGKPRAHFDAIPGGLSVGIPGVVGMLDLAHKKYGKLPWARLFQPAIKLAENGFAVGPKLARTIKNFAPGAKMPDIQSHFYHPDGTPLAEGEIYKIRNMPRLCARSPPKARMVFTKAKSPRPSSTRSSMRRASRAA